MGESPYKWLGGMSLELRNGHVPCVLIIRTAPVACHYRFYPSCRVTRARIRSHIIYYVEFRNWPYRCVNFICPDPF